MRSKRALVAATVTFFLALIALQLTLLARANSCTWDEADHTYAATMQYRGDFGLNPEHPPLVKFLAALPLQRMNLKMPALLDRPYRYQELIGGREFLFENDANAILFRARMATMPLTLLLALLVFLAAQEMFSTNAALIALALLSFDPTLLAHSALVTTDSGQACFLFWAVYAFYRYIRKPTALRLLAAGLITGLALASKHSAVLLLPMLLLLALSELFLDCKVANTTMKALRLAAAFATVCALSVAVLWAFYGFRFAAREPGLALNPTVPVLLVRVPSQAEAHLIAFAAHWRLLPESYLYGFAHVLIQSHAFHSFLLGRIYPHPVWFYFPVAMLIKSSLSFLILLAIAIWALATRRLRPSRELLYLLIPATIYMAFAMAGGMNIGVRHILPIYIFLDVFVAAAAWALIEQNRRWLYGVAALLLFQAVSVVAAFPAYVSYANEAFGGPANVHLYLSDSSSDWGQQMKSVSAYLQQRNIKDCWFAYFGQGVTDFSYYGIPCKPLITADSLFIDGPHDVPPAIDGPVLMSAGVLSGFEFGPGTLNPYEKFKRFTPGAVIDDGVFVYNGHFDIPLAAALSHMQKSQLLLKDNQPAEALTEAQQAEALAPASSAVVQQLGEALAANGQTAEARVSDQKALALAQAIHPDFQAGTIAALKQRLNASSTKPGSP
jgi:4-amino-4-deoxy-L-arabinose transferase-like glycosyltransferase